MYFLPFNSKTRFVAFKDTPEVEERLGQFLAPGRPWEAFANSPFLQANIVDGDHLLGVFFKRGKSFVTNSSGRPQIEFDGNPKSLLFAFGSYKVAAASGSFSYDNLNENYVRAQISPFSYDPEEESLEEIYREIEELTERKLDRSAIEPLAREIEANRSKIAILSQRNDPLDVIMPAIAAEAGERRAAINDILQQINDLQAPLATGVTDVTNYPTKDQFFDELSKRALKGYVDGLVATRASETDFLSHVFDPSLHNPTYITIGSPSRTEHTSLQDRVGNLENDLGQFLSNDHILNLQGVGGAQVTYRGGGTWRIDTSGIGVGTGDKPQETSFFMGGLLQIASDTGGKWTAWEDAQILGVRLTVSQPPQDAPVVIDVKKNGTSIYTTVANRPTLLPGENSKLAPLPDDVGIDDEDEITVDVVNVGTGFAGSDLTVQIRFEYVQ